MYLYNKCSFLSHEVLYLQEMYDFDLASSIHLFSTRNFSKLMSVYT